MDNIKVKSVEFIEDNKSQAEIEETLLKKHEETMQSEETNKKEEAPKSEEVEKAEKVEEVETKEETPSSELNDEDVLSYIKNRYNKDINSVDDLFAEKNANEELPEDVSTYLKYKKETGRGIADFYNLQKDYTTMEDDQVLADYYSNIEEGLDTFDIQDLLEDKFSFDEELDEARDIKKRKLAKKRELAKAKKYFNDQKDKYKVPLESSGDGLSDKDRETLSAYKSYIDESKTVQDAQKKKYDWFLKKTDEVFNNEFKGFEFNVGEKNFTYKPGDVSEIKNVQKDVSNFVNKYMDKDGLINDAKGYHKALSIAMNPEKYAKFFYEQGMTDAVDNVSKKSKNIDMEVRQASQSVSKDGLTVRSVGDTSSGRGLKIRSIKRV
tara:strand:- start:1017 stop:2156 length:1140 start_codon:yes stop_codon:yes gene_type:complete